MTKKAHNGQTGKLIQMDLAQRSRRTMKEFEAGPFVRNKPYLALGLAITAGFLLGSLFSFRNGVNKWSIKT